jgi:hypothetical protein
MRALYEASPAHWLGGIASPGPRATPRAPAESVSVMHFAAAPRSYWMVLMSTRRFCARPVPSVFGATA